jgi:hypothetical protein
VSITLFTDHDVRRAVVTGLRLRGIDVVTAFELNAHLLEDPDLLSRATEMGRALVTHDDDHLSEARHRQRNDIPFAGVVYVHQTKLTIGRMIEELELLATLGSSEDVANQVVFLPL